MTLKSAAFIGFVGMVLLSAFLLVTFVRDVSNVLDGLTPAMGIAVSLVKVLASLGVTIFLWVFYSKQ